MQPERRARATYNGMNQDLAKTSSERVGYYYQGRNITLVFNKSTGNSVIQNERGNSKLVAIPTLRFLVTGTDVQLRDADTNGILSTQSFSRDVNDIIDPGFLNTDLSAPTIIGATRVRDELIVFTTHAAVDCIWKIDYNYDYSPTVTLLWAGDANFSTSNPIKAEGNFENTKVKKLYWEDGKRNQLRHFNYGVTNPLDTLAVFLDATPEVTFVQPFVQERIPGGNMEAGVAQYCYNYYNINGAQTKISPLSSGYPVSKNGRGLSVNEEGGDAFRIEIDGLDQNYDYIRVYRIMYTNSSGTPGVTILYDAEANTNKLTILDDGSTSIGTSSISELDQLGAGPFYPNTIASKDGILFMGNVQEQEFDLSGYDCRAYTFRKSTTTTNIFDDNGKRFKVNGSFQIVEEETNGVTTTPTAYNVPTNHDAINPSIVPTRQSPTGTVSLDDIVSWNDTAAQNFWSSGANALAARNYQFQYNNTTLGAEGLNIKLEWVDDPLTADSQQPKEFRNYVYRSYKRGEVYRFAVVFWNKYGQKTFAYWIGDFRCPTLQPVNGVTLNRYIYQSGNPVVAYPKFTLKNMAALRDAGAVGYKIVRMERDSTDREVVSQGVVNPLMYLGEGNQPASFKGYNLVMPLRILFSGTTSTAYSNPSNRFNIGFNARLRQIDGINLATVGTLLPVTDPGLHSLSSEEGNSNQLGLRGDYLHLHSPETIFDDSLEENKTAYLRHFGQIKADSLNTLMSIFAATNEYIAASPVPHSSDLGGSPGTTHWKKHYYLGHDSSFTAGTDFGIATRHKGYSMVADEVFLASGASHFDTDNLEDVSVVAAGGLNGQLSETDVYFQRFNNRYYYRRGSYRDMQAIGARTLVTRPYTDYSYFKYVDDNNHWDNSLAQAKSSGTEAQSYFLMAEYVKPLSRSRYSGWTYEARQTNSYIEAGDYVDIASGSTSIINVRNGDTFVSLFSSFRLQWYDSADQGLGNTAIPQSSPGDLTVTAHEWVTFPVESRFNLAYRDDKSQPELSTMDIDKDSLESYNSAYHREMNGFIRPSKPLTFKEVVDFDVITRYSDTKLTNETIDSWLQFRINNFGECDSKRGAITGFYRFNDRFIVTQENGIGLWSINPTALTESTAGTIQLGTGATLQDYSVLSDIYGTRHRMGAVIGKRSLYVMDTDNKKFISVIDDPNVGVSDIKGMYSFFDKQIQNNSVLDGGSPLLSEGVCMGYDPDTYNVYVTTYSSNRSSGGGSGAAPVAEGGEGGESNAPIIVITPGRDGEDEGIITASSSIDYSFTLSYNEITGSFVALHDYLPKLYFNDRRHMFTPGSFSGASTEVWTHNIGDYGSYYGTIQNSYLRHLLAPDAMEDKLWLWLMYRLEVRSGDDTVVNHNLDSYRVWHGAQDTTTIDLDPTVARPNAKQLFRTWRIPIKRDPTSRKSRQRLTNQWVYAQLNFDNNLVEGNSYQYMLHDLEVVYQHAIY